MLTLVSTTANSLSAPSAQNSDDSEDGPAPVTNRRIHGESLSQTSKPSSSVADAENAIGKLPEVAKFKKPKRSQPSRRAKDAAANVASNKRRQNDEADETDDDESAVAREQNRPKKRRKLTVQKQGPEKLMVKSGNDDSSMSFYGPTLPMPFYGPTSSMSSYGFVPSKDAFMSARYRAVYHLPTSVSKLRRTYFPF